jgi:erythromycin esterase-like protein
MTSLDDWSARAAIPFSLDDPAALNEAIDRLVAALGDGVEMLGFGEALHGGEETLVLRNRLFERLAAVHGYTAVAVESSFPKGFVVDDYVAGRGPAAYDDIIETGFGHGFGKLAANRELVEWMRTYNADPAHAVKLRFYGFDMPSCPTGNTGPRVVLKLVVDYLTSLDAAAGAKCWERIEPLLGNDFDWENPAIYADPSKSIGLSPAAAALRVEIEELVSELRVRGPELVAAGGVERFDEALHFADQARQLLSYHAAVARNAGHGRLLGIRDVMMADNLRCIARRESPRGKVFVFAHNAHVQRGKIAAWENWCRVLRMDPFSWWPAGSHVAQTFGPRYAVIGTAIGTSPANGVAEPEAGTLEARLTALPGTTRFLPTSAGRGLSADELAALPLRSASDANLSYVPFTAQSFTDFDAWVVLNSVTYSRGAPPLPS